MERQQSADKALRQYGERIYIGHQISPEKAAGFHGIFERRLRQ